MRTLIGLTTAVLVVGAPSPNREAMPTTTPAARDSTERGRALHALNRLTYGPRPRDVDRVVAFGVDRWIEQQLRPETIADKRLETRLSAFGILALTDDDLADMFYRQQRERRQRQLAMRDSNQSMDARGDRPARRRRQPNRLGRLTRQFQQLTVTRATVSEHQLYEVMVDFWTNHFNVFVGKGPVRYLTPHYIEHVIRPNALGRFEDLLVATAKSPAMLIYLDNAQSVTPGSTPPQLAQLERRLRQARTRARSQGDRIRQLERRLEQARERLPRGLNENYGRELLELHTLGVDGGYTQDDVVSVARILTGWSTSRPDRRSAKFVFNAWAHDETEKTVMGHLFSPAGMDEGMALLKMLARHPSTMRHVSRKLCTRFVSDDPPDGCVETGVRAWEQSDGDLREVLRAIIASAEFWSPEVRGTKTKTPLEFVVSALRAVEAVPDTVPGLAGLVARLGQPLYTHQAPNGYPETQESWVNAGALLNRLNIALAFAAGRVPGAAVDPNRVVGLNHDIKDMVARVNEALLNGTASPNTLRVMQEQAAQTANRRQARAVLIGYALGSPEFQRQ